VIARSDEAKELGIPMGAPYFQYKSLIETNDVAVFSSNYNLYGELSTRVMDTLRMVAGQQQVEVYSIDEAFLELADQPGQNFQHTAMDIRAQVEQWTGIKVSVGLAPTKVLSKLANRLAKKDKEGSNCVLVLQEPSEIRAALEQTEIGDIWGIGYRYAEKLRHWGISTAAKLASMPEGWVKKNLGGVTGLRLVKELKGEACLFMKDPLEDKKMISRAAEKLRRQDSAAGTIEVYLVRETGGKFSYSPIRSALSVRLPRASAFTHELTRFALPLVEALYEKGPRYLKAGVILSDLVPEESIQGNLFAVQGRDRMKQLMTALDNINFSHRQDMVQYAGSGIDRKWKMRQEAISPRYTTRWKEIPVVIADG
jgi:DNA polymerase V